ncbi:MAG: C40 family peptidase [Proteobacteria bacterium]|nr:C40 family peptidase [Pseudomonadota bacterium]
MIAQPQRLIRAFAWPEAAPQWFMGPLLTTVLALAACGSSPSVPDAGRAADPGERAAAAAIDQVGEPYRYGGSAPGGFDCSGLVQYAYGIAGLRVPRTTGQLWSAARPVARDELRPGDLLFFSIEGKMSHVGMYVGNERFVHAPQSGRRVSVASLEAPFYRTAFLRGGRIY